MAFDGVVEGPDPIDTVANTSLLIPGVLFGTAGEVEGFTVPLLNDRLRPLMVIFLNFV